MGKVVRPSWTTLEIGTLAGPTGSGVDTGQHILTKYWWDVDPTE